MTIMKPFMLMIILSFTVLYSFNAPAQKYICEYWIDNDFESSKSFYSDSENITLSLDLSDESEGFHRFRYRISDSNGIWSGIKSNLVYVNPKDIQPGNISLETWIDNSEQRSAHPFICDSLSTSVNVNQINDGYHILHCRLDLNNIISSPINYLFFKNSNENNKIEWCKIWWNEQYDKAETILIDNDTFNSDEIEFSRSIKIPNYILENSTQTNVAIVNILFGNSLGWTSEISSSEVSYPSQLTIINSVPISDRPLTVYRQNEDMWIEGLIPKIGTLFIFSINGTKLFEISPKSESLKLPYLDNGDYIITYKGYSIKLVI